MPHTYIEIWIDDAPYANYRKESSKKEDILAMLDELKRLISSIDQDHIDLHIAQSIKGNPFLPKIH